jgi:hypothetical protein
MSWCWSSPKHTPRPHPELFHADKFDDELFPDYCEASRILTLRHQIDDLVDVIQIFESRHMWFYVVLVAEINCRAHPVRSSAAGTFDPVSSE